MEPNYKIFAKFSDGQTVFVSAKDISDADLDETEIGDMTISGSKSACVTVSIRRHDMLRFAQTVLDVKNNVIRMNGGRPIRYRNIKRAETRWS